MCTFEKKIAMTAQEIRGSIVTMLSGIDDQAVLNACHDLLKNVLVLHRIKVVAYTIQGDALNETEYEKEVMEALNEAAAGKIIRHEELKMEFGIQ